MSNPPYLLPLLLAVALPTLANAAEPSLDQALGGFDSGVPPSGTATEDTRGALESALGGFDDGPLTTGSPTIDNAPAETNDWTLSGDLALSTSISYAHDAPVLGATDYRGLSRLRGFANLELDGKLSEAWATHIEGHAFYDAAYALNGRDDYTQPLLDANEFESEWDSVYLRGRLSPGLDLKLGRQIVVWGKSDNLRVTDLLNPMDQRELGMTDIEELRLPVTMAKLDYYRGNWNLSAMAIPEVRFSKLPAYGSDFYPFPMPPPNEELPASSTANTQYAAAANGTFSGWDLSLYWADRYSDSPYTTLLEGQPTRQHNRQTMVGSAINVATGNWLWKGEVAHFDEVRFNNLPDRSERRSDILLGFEYSGLRDTSLSVETVRRHLHGYDAALAVQGYLEDEWQSAFRYSGDFMNARLTLLAVVTALGPQLDDGGFGRFSASYELAAALKLIGGVVVYEGGTRAPTIGIGDNDRLFVEVKYSF